ncbi:hypothetical protein CRG98_000523 [Punica granatum]|uniref:Uncharacterized protein n=1 Tax=Punica granatum TaxID=22663 RepID=A0A2I0LED6_PUNGR|nr:hypothetical protein CRG98_000523 [Punica granatum]
MGRVIPEAHPGPMRFPITVRVGSERSHGSGKLAQAVGPLRGSQRETQEGVREGECRQCVGLQIHEMWEGVWLKWSSAMKPGLGILGLTLSLVVSIAFHL